ncbi:hypothetical protein [Gaetbulibacter aestuarii]|uniref:Uncharacterized protein n=1 Tax=Gaetbulibacter aestuarii TaxID=1502358 RepID=A0ABW7N026_9FLAO
MKKLSAILKRIFFPVTLLTFLVVGSIFVAGNALYIWISKGGETAIYPAVTIPIMGFFIGLYLIDRWLINKITYIKIMIGEGLIFVGVFLLFLFQNKTVDLQFETKADYVLVLFDAEENSITRFADKGVFGKELVWEKNVIHLDATMNNRKDLRILAPEDWEGFIQGSDVYKPEKDSLPYVFIMKHKLDTGNWIKNQTFIDSIIQRERMR